MELWRKKLDEISFEESESEGYGRQASAGLPHADKLRDSEFHYLTDLVEKEM